MDFGILPRNITDASAGAVRNYGQVAHDMFARALCYREVLIVLEMIVPVEKGMADKGRPHHGGNALGKEEGPRLIVEVIAPACSRIAGGPVLHEPIQRGFGFRSPCRLRGSLV